MYKKNKLIFKKNKGISLIELMVGMTIGLFFLAVITETVILSSTQKKQTVGSSAAQNSAQVGSYYLERDIRTAGYGITDSATLGCNVIGYNNSTSQNLNFTLAPVIITPGNSNEESDTIRILYGNGDVVGSEVTLLEGYDGSDDDLIVNNRYGLSVKDTMVLYSPDTDNCVLMEVSGAPTDPTKTTTVEHINATYNKPGGLGEIYFVGTQVINFGSNPKLIEYNVTDNNLIRTNILENKEENLTNQVAVLKAYYLKDTDGNGSIDKSDQIQPTNASQWSQVVGIRFALVAKTNVRNADPISSIVLFPELTLSNGDVLDEITYDIVGTEDKYYSYKVYQTIVPLKNILWRNS